MFQCPSCGVEANKLIDVRDVPKLVCSSCRPSTYSEFKQAKFHELGWTDVKDGNTRVSKGKAWEISNRTVRDGQVINRVTGKPAQR